MWLILIRNKIVKKKQQQQRPKPTSLSNKHKLQLEFICVLCQLRTRLIGSVRHDQYRLSIKWHPGTRPRAAESGSSSSQQTGWNIYWLGCSFYPHRGGEWKRNQALRERGSSQTTLYLDHQWTSDLLPGTYWALKGTSSACVTTWGNFPSFTAVQTQD